MKIPNGNFLNAFTHICIHCENGICLRHRTNYLFVIGSWLRIVGHKSIPYKCPACNGNFKSICATEQNVLDVKEKQQELFNKANLFPNGKSKYPDIYYVKDFKSNNKTF